MSVVEERLFKHAFSAHKTQVLVKPLVPSFCHLSVTLDHLVLLALLENLVQFLQIWVETGMPCITFLFTQECMDWKSLRLGDLNKDGVADCLILSHFAVVC